MTHKTTEGNALPTNIEVKSSMDEFFDADNHYFNANDFKTEMHFLLDYQKAHKREFTIRKAVLHRPLGEHFIEVKDQKEFAKHSDPEGKSIYPICDLPKEARRHIVVAGGAPLSVTSSRKFEGDVDLFIYGDCDPTKVVRAILDHWTTNYEVSFVALSKHALTMRLKEYKHPYQIILRRHVSITQVLLGSDLDPCRVGWFVDEKKIADEDHPWNLTVGKFVILPTAQVTIEHNIVLPNDFLSTSTEDRIYKYVLKKGFQLYIPGLQELNENRFMQFFPSDEIKPYGATYLLSKLQFRDGFYEPSITDYGFNCEGGTEESEWKSKELGLKFETEISKEDTTSFLFKASGDISNWVLVELGFYKTMNKNLKLEDLIQEAQPNDLGAIMYDVREDVKEYADWLRA